jgi:hypothetical protein
MGGGFMRKRPWIIAAMISACWLLVLVAAYPLASQVLASPRMQRATPAPAQGAQVAREDATSGVGEGDARGDEQPADATSATTLDRSNVRAVLGSAVRSSADEDMGRVVDVIVDRAGTARAAVIDFGGFLGVGSRKIAIDWNAMRFIGLNHITLDLTRDQVKAAPEYQADSKSFVVLGVSPELMRLRVTERTPEH